MLLWLWGRLAAMAPNEPLAWEPPYAASADLKSRRKKKKRTTFHIKETEKLDDLFFENLLLN